MVQEQEISAENRCSMRLQKYLAAAGVASRRSCELLIAEGRVQVNGEIVTTPGQKVDSEKDSVCLDGRQIFLAEEKRYVLLYKPIGYLSAVSDDRGRKTVIELVKEVQERIYPVGRLDYDTEGLLLLTNDGEWANGLMHPRHEIEKTYVAMVRGIPTPEEISRLEKGVQLEDGMTAPAKARMNKTLGKNALVEITIHEGRNRQVRRMFAAVGHPVIALKRVRIGRLTLGDLRPGQWRFLLPDEVCLLQQGVKNKE